MAEFHVVEILSKKRKKIYKAVNLKSRNPCMSLYCSIIDRGLSEDVEYAGGAACATTLLMHFGAHAFVADKAMYFA